MLRSLYKDPYRSAASTGQRRPIRPLQRAMARADDRVKGKGKKGMGATARRQTLVSSCDARDFDVLARLTAEERRELQTRLGSDERHRQRALRLRASGFDGEFDDEFDQDAQPFCW